MTPAPRGRAAVLRRVLVATLCLSLVGGAAWVGLSRSAQPSRCAPGMTALGSRCCGEGQRLERDGDGADARCAGEPAACAAGLEVTPRGCVAPPRVVRLPGGRLRRGAGDWETAGLTGRDAEVGAFALDAHEVTEERWSRCVAAGACAEVPLSGEPGRAVAGVTLAEAAAFCAHEGGRLPTRDELAFAAAGSGARRYAWGDTGAVCRRVAWGMRAGPCAEGAAGPEIAGSHPDGHSPENVADLAGNVAEWTQPEPEGAALAEVRGGSWQDGAASALRSWAGREVPVGTRSAAVGARCAYRVP